MDVDARVARSVPHGQYCRADALSALPDEPRGEPSEAEAERCGCFEDPGPGCFADAEMEALVRQTVGSAVWLLDPCHAEIVWRSQVLRQPLAEIAEELHLSECTVKTRLRAGMRELVAMLVLTLEAPGSE